MRKILVVGVSDPKIRDELIILLKKMNIDNLEILSFEEYLQIDENGLPSNAARDDEESCVTVIIVVSEGCSSNPELEPTLRRAVNCQHRAVGIWPPKARKSDIPQAFIDYGSSVVDWDLDKIKRVVLTNTADEWCFSDGEPAPTRPVKRNRC